MNKHSVHSSRRIKDRTAKNVGKYYMFFQFTVLYEFSNNHRTISLLYLIIIVAWQVTVGRNFSSTPIRQYSIVQ